MDEESVHSIGVDDCLVFVLQRAIVGEVADVLASTETLHNFVFLLCKSANNTLQVESVRNAMIESLALVNAFFHRCVSSLIRYKEVLDVLSLKLYIESSTALVNSEM